MELEELERRRELELIELELKRYASEDQQRSYPSPSLLDLQGTMNKNNNSGGMYS